MPSRRLCTGLPPRFEATLLTILAVQMLVRGFDYLSGDRAGTSVALEYAERSLPLAGWGALFGMAGLAVIAAAVTRCQMVLLAGLTIGAAAYTALTVAMFFAVANDTLDGVRTPTDAIGNAALCAGLAVWIVVRTRMAEMRREQLEAIDESGDQT